MGQENFCGPLLIESELQCVLMLTGDQQTRSPHNAPVWMVDRTHRELTDDDIARIAVTYHVWHGREDTEGYADQSGYCKSPPLEEVLKHDHALTSVQYFGVESQENDGEPFEEKMTRLVAELQAQQTEGARLDAASVDNLKALGFGDSKI